MSLLEILVAIPHVLYAVSALILAYGLCEFLWRTR